ncbi:MAG: UDP-N-acetylmuramoyl-L-alanyl-D-glutamate--2,6-diaminopimelate ligase, partial [Gemmatimonadetes bacterium]|nr:UDP-N-acetylmuramoyl-L-alanyl-D-glutamate--2,6-diaminopimelate ligase [Gemmatimonadota bacterium]NIQ55587.1 UDP-N-acetylmuramoyl-L-alanyl-D-glutamate--2,6-diaminopimelate ligase [Gemmatimonadota bacterium]NIU75791.1 UDP-N-acetylmuramoyl-L-alanyl-D-glutamate--2,6-diaminopimelate ligase [Gammaproteobacteria bacterium]NIX45436.1 UDP-N-acetylmuramoyl-L-alanyl-D-glutamate--2,6-diaminopimelate ligase [Gemmatimonadota bacterium]
DAGKRPEMGRVAAGLADVVVVTSDNPRTEDPDAIIDQIMAGIDGEAVRVTDRREAIGRALEMARPDDLVLLAGKGHERYQVLGTETVPFDERRVVREWTEAKGAG